MYVYLSFLTCTTSARDLYCCLKAPFLMTLYFKNGIKRKSLHYFMGVSFYYQVAREGKGMEIFI